MKLPRQLRLASCLLATAMAPAVSHASDIALLIPHAIRETYLVEETQSEIEAEYRSDRFGLIITSLRIQSGLYLFDVRCELEHLRFAVNADIQAYTGTAPNCAITFTIPVTGTAHKEQGFIRQPGRLIIEVEQLLVRLFIETIEENKILKREIGVIPGKRTELPPQKTTKEGPPQ